MFPYRCGRFTMRGAADPRNGVARGTIVPLVIQEAGGRNSSALEERDGNICLNLAVKNTMRGETRGGEVVSYHTSARILYFWFPGLGLLSKTCGVHPPHFCSDRTLFCGNARIPSNTTLDIHRRRRTSVHSVKQVLVHACLV